MTPEDIIHFGGALAANIVRPVTEGHPVAAARGEWEYTLFVESEHGRWAVSGPGCSGRARPVE